MKNIKRTILIGFILSMSLMSFSAYVLEAKSTVEDVSVFIWCPCDCNMLLSNCECETANQLKYQIEQMILQEKTTNQILSELQGIYGNEILAKPLKSNLELLLWIVPVLSIVSGTFIIYLLVQRKNTIKGFKGDKYEIKELESAEDKYDQIFNEEYTKIEQSR